MRNRRFRIDFDFGKLHLTRTDRNIMYRIPLLAAVALLMLVPIDRLHAHHSFAAEFDADSTISVEGNIVEVRYRNPHVQYFIDTDNNERWNVQAQNVPSLRRRGWSVDTLKVGDRITVNGFAGRDGAKKIYVESIIAPSGETLAMYDDAGKSTANPNAAAASEAVAVADSSIASQLIGHWAFDVDKPLPGAPLHLEFQQSGDSIAAIFDNENLPVVVGVDSFTMVLKRENFGGFPAQLQVKGSLVNGALEGTIDLISGYTTVPSLDARSFVAKPATAELWDHSSPAEIQPVDLTGIWTRIISLGPIGRTTPQLNAAGQARHAEYQKGLYDPTLRCMSTGIMRRYAEPGLVEIIATTNRLTFLYANGSDIRRIWFDREQHTANRPRDIMGESIASWDGSTLVIETSNLAETIFTHNSEPISENARIVERYWLNDAGEMTMEATLHDSTYYVRPVVRRTHWKRADGQEMIYSPCDPDSFYRGMQIEGELDNYFLNSPGGDQN